MLLGTGFCAYIIPDSDYVNNWKTPKYFESGDLKFIVLSVAGFILAACFVNLASKSYTVSFRKSIDGNVRIPWPALWVIFYAAFALIIVAYFIWLISSLRSGLSLSDFAASLGNEPDADYVIKEKTETLPGITTFTQLGMGLCLLGTILGFKFGWKKNLWALGLPLLVVASLAVARARFRDERIAILELAIPVSILSLGLLTTAKWPKPLRLFLGFVPFLAPIGLYLFFSAAEYSRAWTDFYQGKEESSFFWFSFVRLVGYYVTSLNNGAAFVQTVGQYAVPFHSLEWFWKFPLVQNFIQYQTYANPEPLDDYQEILTQKLNPELNNPSGVFVLQLDYGFIGGIAAWSLLGAIGMILYRAFRKGSFSGLLLYPFFYIGLLESPRILYWTATRALPSWVMLFGLLLTVAFATTGDWRKRKNHAENAPTEAVPLGQRRRLRRVL